MHMWASGDEISGLSALQCARSKTFASFDSQSEISEKQHTWRFFHQKRRLMRVISREISQEIFLRNINIKEIYIVLYIASL